MGVYVTEAEVRAEGVPDSTPKSRINSRIAKWEALVEKLTRNVFRVMEPGELTFDGNNSDLMHFDLPLVEVESITINEETEALSSDEYRAFTGKAPPQDDRSNPKIQLTGHQAQSLFRRTHGVFYKGLNQLITAKWGYVDDDPDNPGQYLTPQPIKDSIIELTTLDLDGYFDTDPAGRALSSIRRERTDGHEIEYQDVEAVRSLWAFMPKSIADLLALYRGPWKIAAPDNRYYVGRVYQINSIDGAVI